MNSGWRRVSKEHPCPICGKPDACKTSGDGAVAMCKRIEQGAFKQSKGWYFHRLADKPQTDYVGKAHRGNGKAADAKTHRTPEDAIRAAQKQAGGELGGVWTYQNADGSEAMRSVRFNLADGDKSFRPIRPRKGGWSLGDPAGKLPLYRLPHLADTQAVFVTEGEKCADAAVAIGLPATTSAHGSGAAEKSDWTPLDGKWVVVLPDHDEPGQKYARDVARLAFAAGAAGVKIVELPGLPVGGDIVEFLAAGGSREKIVTLADGVPWLDRTELVGGPVLTCLASVKPVAVKWLWPGRIPLGRITLLVGAPGEGKSFASIDFTSRVSTGTPWPDGAACPQGSAILVSAEDDPGDTIRPRLDAHRADCRRVHLLSAVRHVGEDGNRVERMVTLADLADIESALKSHPDCKLLVVDPIGSFLGGDVDGHRDNEVRSVLAPIAALAAKYGPAVLVIAHRRKGNAGSADESALGSRAFVGLARATWHVSRDPDNRRRRLFLPGKNNLSVEGDGLAFTIGGDPPCVEWEREPVTMSADDALSAERDASGPGRPAEERDDARDWLRGELTDGMPHAVGDIRSAAKDAGIVWRTIQRAAAALRVERRRSGFAGGFTWRLPLAPAHTCHNSENGNSGTYGTNGEFPRKLADSGVTESHTCHNSLFGTNGQNGREMSQGGDGVGRPANGGER